MGNKIIEYKLEMQTFKHMNLLAASAANGSSPQKHVMFVLCRCLLIVFFVVVSTDSRFLLVYLRFVYGLFPVSSPDRNTLVS
jgi:hypothetical protein